MRALVLCLALAGCGGADPCDGHTGACLSLRVESQGVIGALDQLSIHLGGAVQLDGRTPGSPGAAVALPIATAIYLPSTSGAVDIAVLGLRGGVPVGQGAAAATIRPGAHIAATVSLASVIGGGDADLAGGGDDLATLDGGGAIDLTTHDLAGLQVRYVFLLPQHASNLGLESGLDGECSAAASSAGLPGSSYRVVIAYPTSSPHDAITLGAGRSIVLPDGTAVATDSTFFSMSHLAPIDQLANGTVVNGCVFTDFNPNGDKIQAAAGDCGGWTGAASDVAYVGDSMSSDLNWNFADTPSCSGLSCYLYCIQQ